MHAKFALPLFLAVLSTTGCSTTQSRPLRQLPKFSSAEFNETARVRTRQTQEVAKRPDPRTHVFLKVGTRVLKDDTFWSEVDRPLAFSAEIDYRRPDSAIGAEFGFGFAIDAKDRAAVDTVGKFYEIYGGIRFTGDMGPDKQIHPYLGVGLTAIVASERHVAGPVDDDDSDIATGAYAHIGAYYSINRHIHVGIDGRVVFGTDMELFGIDTNADYQQLSLIFGTGF